MQDDGDRFDAIENELGAQRQSLNDIREQLLQIIALVNTANPVAVPASTPPEITNSPVTSPNLPNTSTHRLKPASPSEFTGDRVRGRAFLNSCDLYIGLAPTQFANDDAKIYWVLSFMKVARAARFTDRAMRIAQSTGSLPWLSWADFRLEFVRDFCPKNEVQTARTDLETTKYHQGSRSVDEYVDEFRELVDRAKYTEGSNIALKFRHGLNSTIQNYIACLTHGRPSDDNPEDWYDAAILCDENRIANAAFQSTFRSTRTTSQNGGILRNPFAGAAKNPVATPLHTSFASSSTGISAKPA